MLNIDSSLTLADRVFAQIQNAIVRGELSPGQKIGEAELSTMFGVSRGPLREAIRRLEGRGLVVRKPHSGTTVVAVSAEELVQLYYVREALEGMACRLAAQHMPDEEIAELHSLLKQHQLQIEQDQGQSYYQSEGDFDFHYRIVQGSRNEKLKQMLCGDLYHLVRMYRYRFSSAQGRPQQALAEHLRIVEAIADRDGELAELLMRRHIAASRRNAEKRLQVNTLTY